jgi:hypothetical protein
MTAGNRVIPPNFERQLEELAVPVMRKPFDMSELLDTVEQAARKLRPPEALADA